jgi:hypothetical protein
MNLEDPLDRLNRLDQRDLERLERHLFQEHLEHLLAQEPWTEWFDLVHPFHPSLLADQSILVFRHFQGHLEHLQSLVVRLFLVLLYFH